MADAVVPMGQAHITAHDPHHLAEADLVDKGLARDSVGLVSSIALGLSSVAPAYALTATLGPTVTEAGLQMPACRCRPSSCSASCRWCWSPSATASSTASRRTRGSDERDTTLLGGPSRPLGEAVRDHSRPQVAPVVTGDPGPGLMVFDAAGGLMSINDDASAWLDEVAGDLAGDDGFGVRLPLVVVSTLIRARAIAEERAHGSARARMRSSATGRWLVCHASCLRDAEGGSGAPRS